jgi:hypothetical protein
MVGLARRRLSGRRAGPRVIALLLAALTLQQGIAELDAGRPGQALALRDPTYRGLAQLEALPDPRVAQQTLKRAPESWRQHLFLALAFAVEIEDASLWHKIGLARSMKREIDAALLLAPDQPEVHWMRFEYLAHAPFIAGGGSSRAQAEAQVLAKLDPFLGRLARAQLSGDWSTARPETPQQLALLARTSKRREDQERAIAQQPRNAILRYEHGDYSAACALDPLFARACLRLHAAK